MTNGHRTPLLTGTLTVTPSIQDTLGTVAPGFACANFPVLAGSLGLVL